MTYQPLIDRLDELEMLLADGQPVRPHPPLPAAPIITAIEAEGLTATDEIVTVFAWRGDVTWPDWPPLATGNFPDGIQLYSVTGALANRRFFLTEFGVPGWGITDPSWLPIGSRGGSGGELVADAGGAHGPLSPVHNIYVDDEPEPVAASITEYVEAMIRLFHTYR